MVDANKTKVGNILIGDSQQNSWCLCKKSLSDRWAIFGDIVISVDVEKAIVLPAYWFLLYSTKITLSMPYFSGSCENMEVPPGTYCKTF